MGLQLQQQFREDTPGPSMVGKTVVKLFDDVPYVGKITEFHPDPDAEDHYHVLYEDGDAEDLFYNELFVKEWPKLDRHQILWLDEKHKKVVIGASNRHEWLFYVDPEDPDYDTLRAIRSDTQGFEPEEDESDEDDTQDYDSEDGGTDEYLSGGF